MSLIINKRINELRKELKSEILGHIKYTDSSIIINGSWKHDDFHFDFNSQTSFSDLDLYSYNLEKKRALDAQQSIQKNLNKYKIKVSIHPNNLLNEVNIETLNKILLPEYFLQSYINDKLHKQCPLRKNYINSKFSLIALRNNSKQRYFDILNLYDDLELNRLYKIKIGITKDIIENTTWVRLEKKYPKLNLLGLTKKITKDMVMEKINATVLGKDENFLIENIRTKFHKLCF
ncbi:hypothetical protein [Psychroserpens sp. SPM9]|uniref:hypothetical protein n=1 Tax=Psychroserpens sp. SPM9 TaxID=2975598 RepID=UPI0021A6B466|nr:hypothetical protein [Psychroserpens sp. SPM9]MDG5490612.1 hypothetical protein [Psychroserpens sp. SPM9]